MATLMGGAGAACQTPRVTGHGGGSGPPAQKKRPRDLAEDDAPEEGRRRGSLGLCEDTAPPASDDDKAPHKGSSSVPGDDSLPAPRSNRAARRRKGARGARPRAGAKAHCHLIIGRAQALAAVATDAERALAMAHLEEKKMEIEKSSGNQGPGPPESDMGARPGVSDAPGDVSELADEEFEEAARQAIASVPPSLGDGVGPETPRCRRPLPTGT